MYRVEKKMKASLSENKYFIGMALLMSVVVGLTLFQAPEADSQTQRFNRNDLMFMNMMIVHHDQAIEMAGLASNRTDNKKLLRLAQNISEAQRAENRQMTEWMQSMGYEPGNHHPMAGMASRNEMQELRNSEDEKFDVLFAELMIEHHRGGIEMARNFRQAGKNPELKRMQTDMIETQQKEIEKMQDWQQKGF